ncbi:MAG: hypothetical protein HRK26_05605 [Rickettsiaceae bacterium H1]|nr:hypothetical protein [Rickettsiaceae bacterium H1]
MQDNKELVKQDVVKQSKDQSLQNNEIKGNLKRQNAFDNDERPRTDVEHVSTDKVDDKDKKQMTV